jgi:hypothetical protein
MKILQQVDLLNPPTSVDAVCITTNGIRKKDGSAVMGKGVALGAAKKWPQLPQILGTKLAGGRLRLEVLLAVSRHPNPDLFILALPTKRDWKDPSPWDLVMKSLAELVHLTNGMDWKSVWLPPPGCGNGGLSWSKVAAATKDLLNDRFTIIFRR